MIMKTKMMIAALVMLFATTTMMNAQNNERARQRMNTTEMFTRMAERLAGQMKLSEEKANAFKVLYLDYQTARQNAANPRGEGNEREQVDVTKLTDEEAAERIQKHFQAQEAQLAVDKEYYAKFTEIITPAQAAQVFLMRGMGGGRQGGNNRGRMGGGRQGGFGGGGFGGGGFGGGNNDF